MDSNACASKTLLCYLCKVFRLIELKDLCKLNPYSTFLDHLANRL